MSAHISGDNKVKSSEKLGIHFSLEEQRRIIDILRQQDDFVRLHTFHRKIAESIDRALTNAFVVPMISAHKRDGQAPYHG